ncbi:MAG: spermidine synthase [Sandaracinaceae bacterium]
MTFRGAGRELQVEGTCASWYQPGQHLTGSVWDALAVPLAALPADRRDGAALILGLGGGSAARLLRAAAPDLRLVGVEVDLDVIEVARRHMDLDALDVDVVAADAGAYLAASEERFDLILEDCFAGGEDGLEKPRGFPHPGLRAARARLSPGGVLVTDTIHEARETELLLRELFASVVRVEPADCTNQVLVGTDRPLDARALRRAVNADPTLRGALGHLRFRTVVRG